MKTFKKNENLTNHFLHSVIWGKNCFGRTKIYMIVFLLLLSNPVRFTANCGNKQLNAIFVFCLTTSLHKTSVEMKYKSHTSGFLCHGNWGILVSRLTVSRLDEGSLTSDRDNDELYVFARTSRLICDNFTPIQCVPGPKAGGAWSWPVRFIYCQGLQQIYKT